MRSHVNVHEPTMNKTLNSNVEHDRVVRTKALLYKENIAACLQFAKDG